MPPLDDFGRAYLRLTLHIDRHVPGYVDAYTGPPDLKEEVAAGDLRPIAALQDDLAWLKANTPQGDPERRAYLLALFRAMDCTLRMQAGETFEYLDEVARLYDIQPQKADEAPFEAARKVIDDLLPGDGSPGERLEARRKRYELAPDTLLRLLEIVRDECRRRTAALVTLPDDEEIEMALVSDQPWAAYNWYKGHGRSRIEFNTDIPVALLSLPDLIAHEGYPGHHTEHLIKERVLLDEKGYAEEASFLLHSPAAVIAEGIATTAAEIIFPNGSLHEYLAGVLLPEAGMQGEDAETIRRLSEAQDALRYVAGNAAILYHSGDLDQERTIDYLQTYRLVSRPRAEQSFRFISNPLYRSYVFTYSEGYDLIGRAAKDGDKKPVFLRLLHGQVLPSELADSR